MSRKRRTWTAEFKIEAVKLITEEGYSIAEAALSLVGSHALPPHRASRVPTISFHTDVGAG